MRTAGATLIYLGGTLVIVAAAIAAYIALYGSHPGNGRFTLVCIAVGAELVVAGVAGVLLDRR